MLFRSCLVFVSLWLAISIADGGAIWWFEEERHPYVYLIGPGIVDALLMVWIRKCFRIKATGVHPWKGEWWRAALYAAEKGIVWHAVGFFVLVRAGIIYIDPLHVNDSHYAAAGVLIALGALFGAVYSFFLPQPKPAREAKH